MMTPPSVSDSGFAARRRPRWIIPVVATLIALLLVAALGYRYWISTPQYALLQAKGAYESHDLVTFEKYVAIDSCADAFTTDMLAEATAKLQAQSDSDPNPFSQAGRSMAEGLLKMLKPALSSTIKSAAREFVSSGQIAPLSGGSSTGPVDLEAIKKNIEKGGLHFDGIGNVGVDNDTATVELRFRSQKKGRDEPVQIELRRTEGHWQVAQWKNAAEWMKQFASGVMAP